MPRRIFVNYRRDDARDMAARVRDRMATAFGNSNVFMDVDNLLMGQRFDVELEKALAQTDVFLAVLGPRWLDLLRERHTTGERDYVREEIAAALKRNIIVIPLLIESAKLPRADELPEDMRDLVLHQAHSITHAKFGRDVAEVGTAIQSLLKVAGRQRATTGGQRGFAMLAGAGAFFCLIYAAGMISGLIPWPLTDFQSIRAPVSSAEDQKRIATLEVGMQQEREGRAKAEAEAEARYKAEQEARARAEAETKKLADAAVARQKAEVEANAAAAAERLRVTEAAKKLEEDRNTGAGGRLASLVDEEQQSKATSPSKNLKLPGDVESCKFMNVPIGARKPGTVAIIVASTAADRLSASVVRRLIAQAKGQIVIDTEYPIGTLDFARILVDISMKGPDWLFHCSGSQQAFALQMGGLSGSRR